VLASSEVYERNVEAIRIGVVAANFGKEAYSQAAVYAATHEHSSTAPRQRG
jgi:hypothetical protein